MEKNVRYKLIGNKLNIYRSNDGIVDSEKLFDEGYDVIIANNSGRDESFVLIYFELYTGKFGSFHKISNFNGMIILL